MYKLKNNNEGNALPLILFVLTIVVVGGALYTLLFIEIALPLLSHLIPTSDAKTFILMCIYGIPFIILIIGIIWLIKMGIRREVFAG